jgi:Ca-activated chloride channel homolog
VSLAAHLLLQRIAETTGARFLAAPSSRDLKGVYDELGSKIGFVKQKQEVVFVAARLLLTVAGAAVSLAWFKRLP